MSKKSSPWRTLDVHSIDDLVNDWFNRLREAQTSHYRAANFYRSIHLGLGLAAVVSSTIALANTFNGSTSRSIALLSVLAALAAGIQTAGHFGEQSEKHKQAGARFSGLRREIEFFNARRNREQPSLDPLLETVKDDWKALIEEVPVLPRWIWLTSGRPRKHAESK